MPAGRDLGSFFSDRLDRTAIPELAVSDIAVSQTGAATRLTFQLSQKSKPPFALRLPVEVTTATGVEPLCRRLGAGRDSGITYHKRPAASIEH